MKTEYFSSSDIACVATLCSLDYSVDSIERIDQKRVIFHIVKDKKLDEILKLYYANQIKVNPITYFNELKNIKTRIYNS